MNYLLEAFTGMPVTVSSLVIAISVVVVALLSVVFLEAVKFIINQDAWKTEIVDSKILFNKILKMVTKAEEVPFIRYNSEKFFIKYKVSFGKFIWENSDNDGLAIKNNRCSKSWLDGSYAHEISKYTNMQDMLQEAGDRVEIDQQRSCKIGYKVLTLGVLGLDLLFTLFKIAPFETTLITGIITLVFSIRWVSGKLANNVEKTSNHEERITKLEGEK